MMYFHFPFLGPGSAIGAEAVECAGEQGRSQFWSLHESIYELEGDVTVDSVLIAASEIDGFDLFHFTGCLESGRHSTTWQLDRARASAMGANSTPTIFVAYLEPDGQQQLLQFLGAQQFEQFSRLLDAILERVEQ